MSLTTSLAYDTYLVYHANSLHTDIHNDNGIMCHPHYDLNGAWNKAKGCHGS